MATTSTRQLLDSLTDGYRETEKLFYIAQAKPMTTQAKNKLERQVQFRCDGLFGMAHLLREEMSLTTELDGFHSLEGLISDARKAFRLPPLDLSEYE